MHKSASRTSEGKRKRAENQRESARVGRAQASSGRRSEHQLRLAAAKPSGVAAGEPTRKRKAAAVAPTRPSLTRTVQPATYAAESDGSSEQGDSSASDGGASDGDASDSSASG